MQGGRWVWCGVVLVFLAIVFANPRAGDARTVSRRASAEAKVAASAEIYRSAIVVDADSGAVLFEKDAHRQNPPASMTKMMLMLIVAERVRDGSLRWDDPITTSAWASKVGGSQVYLKQGETFPLSEMMEAIAIHSANDASVAVAETVAGSSDAFVELMGAPVRAGRAIRPARRSHGGVTVANLDGLSHQMEAICGGRGAQCSEPPFC